MLITLGLGSAIGLLSSVTTTLNDSFPTIDKKTIIKLCCVVGFAIGIFYVTPGGMLMLDMVDHYGGTMLILGLASFEVIGIAWVYGTNVVTRDFNFMFETELSVYWRICWGFICPLLLPGLFIYLVFVDGGPFVEKDIAQSSKQTMAICGYTLAGTGLLFVPFHLLFTITAEEHGERFLVRLWNTIRGGRFGGKLCKAFLPNNSWGPSSIKERRDWQVYSETHSKLEFLPSMLRSRLEKDSPDLPK